MKKTNISPAAVSAHAGHVMEAVRLYNRGLKPDLHGAAKNTWVKVGSEFFPAKFLRATTIAVALNTPEDKMEGTVRDIRRATNGGAQTVEFWEALGFACQYGERPIPEGKSLEDLLYVELENPVCHTPRETALAQEAGGNKAQRPGGSKLVK